MLAARWVRYLQALTAKHLVHLEALTAKHLVQILHLGHEVRSQGMVGAKVICNAFKFPPVEVLSCKHWDPNHPEVRTLPQVEGTV